MQGQIFEIVDGIALTILSKAVQSLPSDLMKFTLNAAQDTLNAAQDTLNAAQDTLNAAQDTLNTAQDTLNAAQDTVPQNVNLAHWCSL